MTVLLQSSISTRTFGAWSMKYVPGERRLQGLLRQWGVSQFDPYQLSKVQIDEAVRFMRDEDDAVDTVPSEFQALPAEPVPVAQPSRRVSRGDVTERRPSKTPPAAAPDSKTFMKVVVGVALTGLAALAFTILTVARTGETLGATPQEVDREGKLWVLPAVRMKAGREHRVPLTDTVVRLIDGANGKYLFSGTREDRPLSNMAMLMLLRDLRGEGYTVHGFRSAFSTWAREQTDYPREIVEACLAHASGDAVELAYRRTDFLDKRRALMKAWENFAAERG